MQFVLDVRKWLRNTIDEFRNRRLERKAMSLAVWRFSKLHPNWYESCFDEAFLSRLAFSRLKAIDAEELAREWTRQFRYADQRVRSRDIHQVQPVADSFLRLLGEAKDELRSAATSSASHAPSRIEEPTTPCSGARDW